MSSWVFSSYLVVVVLILVGIVVVARTGGGAPHAAAPKVSNGAKTVVRTPLRRDRGGLIATLDDEVATANGWLPGHRAATERAFRDPTAISGTHLVITASDLDGSPVVGVITVHGDGDLAVGDAPAARLGFWIAREHRRRGYLGDALGAAVDLLDRDGHPAVTAHTATTNTGARRALEANGFETHGAYRRVLQNGTEIDAVMYRRWLTAGRTAVAAARRDVESAD